MCSTPTWRPVLTEASASAAEQVIDGITSDLRQLRPSDTAVTEKVGLALYFAYLSRVGRSRDLERLTAEWLDAAIDDAHSAALAPALYGGVAGLAWSVEHVNAMEAIAFGGKANPDESESNDEVDEALAALVTERPWLRMYDLVGGLVGIGVYFLERLLSVFRT